jgi:CHAD domain-containing protein
MKIVDARNEQGVETVINDTPPSSPHAETSDSTSPDSGAIHRALIRLLRKRVKRFVALAPEVRADANPKIIHDVRVWSRRLQQAIGAFFPKPRSGKVRRLRRTPRRIRRALGEWRNCDVLLEIVARRQRRTRSEAKRRAWSFVRDYLLQKRSKEVGRAGKKLLGQDLGNYAARAQKLMGRRPDESPEILMQRLCESVQGAWAKWQSALARARETRDVGDLHAFRIATKDLRYRIELLYDVGHKEMKPQLKWLADLQDAIGVWHDRQVLHQAVAEAVARADVLLNELQTARTLLAELETDRSRESQDVEKIFRLATEHPGHEQMENWSRNPLTPYPSPLREG